MLLTLIATGAALAPLFLAFRAYRRAAGKRLPLPPGPPESSLMLGNVADIPRPPAEWETYHALSKRYGPVMHLRAVDRHLVILDTMQAAVDLLEKRGAMYSDRTRLPMLGELMGYEWNLTLMGYGDSWRLHRRALHQHLHEGAVPRLHAHFEHTNTRFLQALVGAPGGWWDLTHWLAGANIMSAVYGKDDTQLHDDPWVKLSEEVVRNANDLALGGFHLVDMFPFLKYVPAWLPGAAFKGTALRARALQLRARDEPVEWVKAQLDAGRASPSITSALMDAEVDGAPVPEEVIKNCTGIAYIAGADTTLATLRSFVLAMVRSPDIQRKAQAELDRVLPVDRLPSLADRSAQRLPYLEAVLRETYRKYPPVPLGIPHQSTQEEVYDGMRLPRGAVLIANAWAMLHDEHISKTGKHSHQKRPLLSQSEAALRALRALKLMYPEPEVFRPERFLTAGALDKDVMDPRAAVFGFGRRICPGRHFADAEIWLMMATLLHAFDILPAKDGIYPAEKLKGGIVVAPMEFECRIVPRSAAKRALVINSLDA
ncbi:cytochrome P450 [Auricularia subglabra TFB-10046 SS5]|nr:cytochrome P450 [Auricularia subglabra TFB-10046 SS5]